MGDITRNFSLDEFLVSETADRLGDKNQPTPDHEANLIDHIEVMQIIRDLIDRSVVITSGYRNKRVNKAVGGVPNSDHATGNASDSRAAGLSAYAYASIIADHMREGRRLHGLIDQLILETSRKVVHVSTAPRRRGEIMTQRKGPGTPFEAGIVA